LFSVFRYAAAAIRRATSRLVEATGAAWSLPVLLVENQDNESSMAANQQRNRGKGMAFISHLPREPMQMVIS